MVHLEIIKVKQNKTTQFRLVLESQVRLGPDPTFLLP